MLLYGRWRTWQSTLLNVNVLSICSGTGQSLFIYIDIMLIIPGLGEAETAAYPNGSDAHKQNASPHIWKKKEIQDTKDHLLGPGGWKSYSVDWLLRSALKVKRIRIIKLWKLICKMSSCNTTFKACRHLTHSCDEMKKQLTFALLTFPYSTLPFITKTYSDSGFCLSSYHTITRYYTALWTNILESKISHFWEQR